MTKGEAIENIKLIRFNAALTNANSFREALVVAIEALSQPSLPSDLDDAADAYIRCVANADREWTTQDIAEAFKAGAELMAGQGWIDDGSMPPETKYEEDTMQGHKEWTESEPVLAWDSMYGPRVDVTKNGKWMSEQRGGYTGMKKIMFNDKYGLTKAVLEGRKTMTRRIIQDKDHLYEDIRCMKFSHLNDYGNAVMRSATGFAELRPNYRIGEVVAVAQRYKDIRDIIGDIQDGKSIKSMAGWNNKMFVSADLMPHQIRITNVRVERLQDISDEDIYKEGFVKDTVNNGWGNAAYHWEAILVYYDNLGRTKEISSPKPREAFATLIDKISGNGTWESNPWVFSYEFELVK